MTELNTTKDGESEIRTPTGWKRIISVSLPIALIIAISIFVFDLFPERSENFKKDNVGIETYKSYSLRLDAISERHVKELETSDKTEQDLNDLPQQNIDSDTIATIGQD